MSNTIVAILLYVLIVAIAFAPKCPQQQSVGSTSINYFPDIEVKASEPTTELVNDFPEDNKVRNSQTESAIASESKTNLNTLGIRELKKLASRAKIKNYSRLTKKQLIEALS